MVRIRRLVRSGDANVDRIELSRGTTRHRPGRRHPRRDTAPGGVRLAAPAGAVRPPVAQPSGALPHLRRRRRGRVRTRLCGRGGGQSARRRSRAAPVARVHGDRWVHGPARLRDGRRPLLREPRRLPDRDPGRAPRERVLRRRLGVRRHAARVRAVGDAPPREAPRRGAARHGRVVPLDAREPATSARAEQRGRDRNRARRIRDPRHDRLRRERRALLVPLPAQPHPPLGLRDRLLPAPVRGDDRRRGHGRAQVARELVGVARADRARVRDHRVCRPPRVARGTVPGPLPADDARAPSGRQRSLRRPRRLHELLRAVVRRPRSRRSSTRTGARLRRCSPGGSVARSRSSSAMASSPRSTAAATSPTTPSARRGRLSRYSRRLRFSPKSILAGRACASA